MILILGQKSAPKGFNHPEEKYRNTRRKRLGTLLINATFTFLATTAFTRFSFAQDTLRLAKPIVTISNVFFTDSTTVQIDFGRKSAKVWYSLNGEKELLYTGKIVLKESAVIRAFCMEEDFLPSEKVEVRAVRVIPDALISINKPAPSTKYPDEGFDLVDLLKGENNFNDDAWVGYDQDYIVFQLTTEQIYALGISFYSNARSWILPPNRAVLRWFDANGMKHETMLFGPQNKEGSYSGMLIWEGLELAMKLQNQKNWELVLYPQTLPESHPGAGNKAWIFLDEIFVADSSTTFWVPSSSRKAGLELPKE